MCVDIILLGLREHFSGAGLDVGASERFEQRQEATGKTQWEMKSLVYPEGDEYRVVVAGGKER